MEKNLQIKGAPRGYHEIADFVESLSKGAFLYRLEDREIEKNIDNFLKQISPKRLSVASSLCKLMRKFQQDELRLAVTTFVLSRCNPSKTIKHLVEFSKDPSTTDKLRKKLFLVLQAYNAVDYIPDIIHNFEDKRNLGKEILFRILKSMSLSGENKSELFKKLTFEDKNFYRVLAEELASFNCNESVWLLGSLAEFYEDTVAKIAIVNLGKSKSPYAYEILENLVTCHGERDEIRRLALEELNRSGISRPEYRKFIAYKCYLSWIDGHGNQILIMSQRSGRSRISAVTFILNESIGIKDCSLWSEISGFEMESIIKSLEMQAGLRQITQNIGVQVLEGALWTTIHKKKLLPLSFLSMRRVLGTQKLSSKPYKLNSDHLGLQQIEKNIEPLLKNSSCLLQHSPFKDWGPDTAEAVAFIKERSSLLNGHKVRKGTLAQFVKDIMEEKREIWKNRFLLTADFLYQISPRKYQEQIDTSLALYLSINKGTPLKYIPFMLSLAEITIEQMRRQISVK